jgi:hypothetical protein
MIKNFKDHSRILLITVGGLGFVRYNYCWRLLGRTRRK